MKNFVRVSVKWSMRFSAFWVCFRHDFALSKLMIFPTRVNFAMRSEHLCGKFCRARLADWRRCWAGIAPIGAEGRNYGDNSRAHGMLCATDDSHDLTFGCRTCNM